MLTRLRNSLTSLGATLSLLLGVPTLALMLLAEGEAGGEGGEGEGGGEEGGEGEGQEGGENEPELTAEQQAAVEAEVTKRLGASMAKKLAAEQKRWEKELNDAAALAKLDETQRAKADKEATEKAANERVSKANAKLVTAEAKSAALAAGVKPERVTVFLKNVELDGIDVDDDGVFDDKDVSKAVAAALKIVPEFKGGTGTTTSGGEFNGNGEQKKATNLGDAVAAHYASA